MSLKSIQSRSKGPPSDLRWWLADDPHVAVFANAKRLGKYASRRRQDYLYYACLYDDSELAAMVQGSQAIESGIPQTMTTNIVRRQVDTFTSKLVKNRPVPMALTTGGDFGAQRRGKALTKFAEGVLDSVNFWETRELRIRDGAIFGSGFARNYRVGKKLKHERIFPWEVRVEPRDAYRGCPRSIYIRHLVDRLVLTERYPKFEEEIKAAESRSDEDSWDLSWDDEMSDMVLVEEAIHLPSGEIDLDEDPKKRDTDGAYAMCISNATLTERDYLRDYHPLSKFTYSPPLMGWYGEGMARMLSGLQFEVNSIGLRMQEQGFMTGSYVWAQESGGIEVDTLDNGAMSVIRSMTKPEFFTPAPWHPEFFSYYQQLRGSFAADVTGMSGMASRGEGPPPGVESGKAIRTFHAISDENLIPAGRRDERDVIDTMWQLLDLTEEIHEESKGTDAKYTVRVEQRSDGRSAFKPMDYADVRMDREEFTLRVFPTSYLASTPEDRWEQVSEMAEKGLFSPDEVLTLLDFPDVQRVLNLRGSPRRVVEHIVEKLLDPDFKGTITPEPAMNLDLCFAIGTLAYLEAKWIDGAPEEMSQRVLAFALASRELRDSAQPGAGAGAGPQAGDQDPMALPGEMPPPDVNIPGMPPPGPADLYAPPTDGAPMPANAVAPTAMPAIPPM